MKRKKYPPKNKKADLSMTTIIIAAMVMLTATVLVLNLGNFTSLFSKESNCKQRGGTCYMEADFDKKCAFQPTAFKCTKEKEVCCIDPGNFA